MAQNEHASASPRPRPTPYIPFQPLSSPSNPLSSPSGKQHTLIDYRLSIIDEHVLLRKLAITYHLTWHQPPSCKPARKVTAARALHHHPQHPAAENVPHRWLLLQNPRRRLDWTATMVKGVQLGNGKLEKR